MRSSKRCRVSMTSVGRLSSSLICLASSMLPSRHFFSSFSRNILSFSAFCTGGVSGEQVRNMQQLSAWLAMRSSSVIIFRSSTNCSQNILISSTGLASFLAVTMLEQAARTCSGENLGKRLLRTWSMLSLASTPRLPYLQFRIIDQRYREESTSLLSSAVFVLRKYWLSSEISVAFSQRISSMVYGISQTSRYSALKCSTSIRSCLSWLCRSLTQSSQPADRFSLHSLEMQSLVQRWRWRSQNSRGRCMWNWSRHSTQHSRCGTLQSGSTQIMNIRWAGWIGHGFMRGLGSATALPCSWSPAQSTQPMFSPQSSYMHTRVHTLWWCGQIASSGLSSASSPKANLCSPTRSVVFRKFLYWACSSLPDIQQQIELVLFRFHY